MKQLTKVMKALSDPGRIKILKMLERREMCVCELRSALGLAQPTVSKHLKELVEAGLIEGRKSAQWTNYALTRGEASAYAAVMLGQLRGWLNDDAEMQEFLNKAAGIRREDLF
ncbi:MAG: transcriptional regulator [Desulfovibrionaceae bacterium CG1_02_65_16]|nr:MAG: transcriptional regulator [Desulfovibrionaceae bacterium CG1_02_65_16]